MGRSISTLNRNKLTRDLLREELKSRKLASMLRSIGVYDSPFTVELNATIAQFLNLKTDKAYRDYDRIMEEHSQKLSGKPGEIEKTANVVARKLGH